jgi:polysaccharide chain length determinant protein (PEP-CTERM system associated)
VLPFVLSATAAIVASSRLPDRYRAETLILTVPQSVPQEYVRTTVTMQIKDRLPTISQLILSRSRLEPIITEFDLYPRTRQTAPLEVVVERMRRDIQVQIVGGASGASDRESESFRVSYESESPVLAMQVTERLAGLFIEENVRDRKVLAQETRAFLESQLEDARRRLVEQERRLEAYRLQYGSQLPAQLASNIQAIQNVQLQIQALNDGINRDRDRRLIDQRQLADLRSEQFLAEPGATTTSAAAQSTSAQAQLEATIAELEALEQRLTPQHPDVARIRERIPELERRAKEEAAGVVRAETRPRLPTVAEIAKRNRVRELEAEIESLDRQIATKTSDARDLQAKLEAYQVRVEAVPTRESELSALTRDYDTLQTLYRTLLAKREDSKIAENLERGQVGQQFKILDPPRRPERPASPNRPLIDLIGAAAGLALGVGLTIVGELRDKTIRSESDARALVIPVLALVPTIRTPAEGRRASWRRAAWSCAVVLILAACGTAAWLTFRI